MNKFRAIYSLIFIVFTGISFSQDDFSDDIVSDSEQSSVTIKGIVTSESGSALAGANVVIEDTDLGAASDENGQYSIENVDLGSSVTASMIGYESVTEYADGEELNFVLIPITLEMYFSVDEWAYISGSDPSAKTEAP